MTVTNISDFRSKIKQYVDNVLRDGSAVVINRGSTAAVLISLEEYNSIKETEALIAKSDARKDVSNVLQELDTYRGIAVDINDL